MTSLTHSLTRSAALAHPRDADAGDFCVGSEDGGDVGADEHFAASPLDRRNHVEGDLRGAAERVEGTVGEMSQESRLEERRRRRIRRQLHDH